MYSCVPVHALQCTTVPQYHLQCTNVPPYPPMYYYNMSQLYPPICHYAPPVPSNIPICLLSTQYTAMWPSLSSSVSLCPYAPRLFRYALISQYAYSLIGSPPQPIQSRCLYFS